MSLKKIVLLSCIGMAGLYACETKKQEEATFTTDTVRVAAPDSIVLDGQVAGKDSVVIDSVVADTTESVKETATNAVLQQTFEGEIEGFKAKSYAFTLAEPAQVLIRVRDRKQAVFKLYRKTGNLDETIVKEDARVWKGELAEGEYQLKVFLPLKQAAQKKRSTFEITVSVRQ